MLEVSQAAEVTGGVGADVVVSGNLRRVRYEIASGENTELMLNRLLHRGYIHEKSPSEAGFDCVCRSRDEPKHNPVTTNIVCPA